MRISFWLILLYCSLCGNAKETSIKGNLTFLPVIDYVPFDFERVVCEGLGFNEAKECYFVNTFEDSDEVIWYNDYLSDNSYKYDTVSISLSSIQKNIISARDSVFIFNPFPAHRIVPAEIKYIGYLDNGSVKIATEEGNCGLSDFLISQFGSIDNYIRLYLEYIKDSFYHEGSGLFSVKNDEEARDVLKMSYLYDLVAGSDLDEVFSLMLSKVNNRINLSARQMSVLKKIAEISFRKKEELLGKFLGGGDVDIMNCCLLQSAFSNAERDIILGIEYEELSRVRNSYRFLSNKIPNTDKNGSYYTDRDVFHIINEIVDKP